MIHVQVNRLQNTPPVETGNSVAAWRPLLLPGVLDG